MEVWIVFLGYDYEATNVVGVYSSRESALAQLESEMASRSAVIWTRDDFEDVMYWHDNFNTSISMQKFPVKP